MPITKVKDSNKSMQANARERKRRKHILLHVETAHEYKYEYLYVDNGYAGTEKHTTQNKRVSTNRNEQAKKQTINKRARRQPSQARAEWAPHGRSARLGRVTSRELMRGRPHYDGVRDRSGAAAGAGQRDTVPSLPLLTIPVPPNRRPQNPTSTFRPLSLPFAREQQPMRVEPGVHKHHRSYVSEEMSTDHTHIDTKQKNITTLVIGNDAIM